MNVPRLAWRSLRQRAVSSVLTVVSVGLGVALTVAIVSLRDSGRSSYERTARGYDVILGPTHGSPLQVVLNTMFHVGDAGGTVPWATYETARKDQRVKYAVPYAVGDMFRGHHVVGTSSEIFEALEDARGDPLGTGIRGRVFDDGKAFQAVVGSVAAANTGLRLDRTFHVTHGTSMEQHGEPWVVVGMLRPTGTPADRGIFVPIDTFYEVGGHKAGAERRKAFRARKAAASGAEGHEGRDDGADEGDEDHGEHDHGDEGDGDHAGDGRREEENGEQGGHADHERGPKEELGLSAVGVRLMVPAPTVRLGYMMEFRDGRGPVQAVIPQDQIRDLFEVVGSVDRMLSLIAALVVLVAGIGILVSLYNTIQGRRREIAILRALGARPWHVFAIIVLEATLLCVLGGVLGLLLGHAMVAFAAPALFQRFGVLVSAAFGWLDLAVLAVLALFGLFVGLVPAWRGLRTPVAENLHPTD